MEVHNWSFLSIFANILHHKSQVLVGMPLLCALHPHFSYSQLLLSALPSSYFNLSVCWVGNSLRWSVVEPTSLSSPSHESQSVQKWETRKPARRKTGSIDEEKNWGYSVFRKVSFWLFLPQAKNRTMIREVQSCAQNCSERSNGLKIRNKKAQWLSW